MSWASRAPFRSVKALPTLLKTTYATGRRVDLDFALFSLDGWLITAFGKYDIAVVGHEEHTRRVLASRALIWDSASELLRRSVDVILDDGFFLRVHRMSHVELAAAVGARTKTHFIDTPIEVVRARLDQRNAKLPRFNFHINPDTLRGFAALFEIPSDAEGAEVVVFREFGPETYDVQ
jgi:hypothetical protein